MKKYWLPAMALGLLANYPAHAEVQINGFASVVMGIDLEDDGNPTADYGGRTVDNLQESKVALQWSADLGEGMRFVGQTMARGDSSEGFALNYDWAYFDFNVGDSGKLKFGRVRIPFYKYSDYLDVGYAYHWISPPKSMYSLSFSNADGVSYLQNFSSGSLEHSLNLVVGRYQGTLRIGGEPSPGNLENLVAVNWSGSVGDHEFYAAYAQADVYIDAALLTTDQAALGNNSIADLAADPSDVLVDGDLGTFVGVGYKGSFGDVGVFAEYSIVQVKDSIIQDEATGGYLGVTYNMGNYVYHLTYEMEEDTAPTIAGAAALTSIARSLGNRSSEGEASTITLGARRDIGNSSAVKIDISSYTEDRYQSSTATEKSEETALILKVAVETMF